MYTGGVRAPLRVVHVSSSSYDMHVSSSSYVYRWTRACSIMCRACILLLICHACILLLIRIQVDACVLHYVSCSFPQWYAKYRKLGILKSSFCSGFMYLYISIMCRAALPTVVRHRIPRASLTMPQTRYS